MKILIKGLITILLLSTISTVAGGSELSGTVVKVSNLDVTVKVEGELMPASGDTMEISFTLPDGEMLPVGTWRIIRVTGNTVTGTVIENTGNPVVGHKATIFSQNPAPLVTSSKAKPLTTQKYSPDITGISDEAQQVIDQLRSTNASQKRDGAKTAARKFATNTTVTDVAAEELEKGHSSNLRDNYHVDAMAWLCNALGASYNKKYAPLLKKIYRESRSKKIKGYAKKNYERLR